VILDVSETYVLASQYSRVLSDMRHGVIVGQPYALRVEVPVVSCSFAD
jgi:hypothetical protein